MTYQVYGTYNGVYNEDFYISKKLNNNRKE